MIVVTFLVVSELEVALEFNSLMGTITIHPMFSLQRKSHRFGPGAPDLGVIFEQDPLRLTGFIMGTVPDNGASDFIRGTVPGTVSLIFLARF